MPTRVKLKNLQARIVYLISPTDLCWKAVSTDLSLEAKKQMTSKKLPSIVSSAVSVSRLSFASQEPDECSDIFHRTLAVPIRFLPLQPSETFSANFDVCVSPNIRVIRTKLRNSRFLLEHPRGYRAISFVRQGYVNSRQGSRFFDLDTQLGVAQNENDVVDLQGSEADCLVPLFNIDALKDHTRKVRQSADVKALDQMLVLSLSTPQGHSFFRSLCFFWDEMQQGSPLLQSPLVISAHEDLLFRQLLQLYELQVGKTEETIPDCSSRTIQRVRDYIMANLDQSISVADLADMAQVSSRTLFKSFKACYGTTPMQFLKRQRLEAVHRVLLSAERGTTTVTQVATNYGFNHLGRFSSDYFKLFQESPKETLGR